MVNTGKKPISKKLEEARLRLFNNDSFKELLKPEFVLKAYDSTFICVLISMILNHFVKSETSKESITAFINLLISNTKDNLDVEDVAELSKTLLMSHPFTHRMVLSLHSGQEVHPILRCCQCRLQDRARRDDRRASPVDDRLHGSSSQDEDCIYLHRTHGEHLLCWLGKTT